MRPGVVLLCEQCRKAPKSATWLPRMSVSRLSFFLRLEEGEGEAGRGVGGGGGKQEEVGGGMEVSARDRGKYAT